MNNRIKILIAPVTLMIVLSGCGREGAQFYTLQKQHNQLADTVSNLQTEVNELSAENNRLRIELATKSQAITLLIQEQRQNEMNLEKLMKQPPKNPSAGQSAKPK